VFPKESVEQRIWAVASMDTKKKPKHKVTKEITVFDFM